MINKDRDARWEPPPAIGPLFDSRFQLESYDASKGTQEAIDTIQQQKQLVIKEIERLQMEAEKKLTADQLKVGFDKTVIHAP